MELTKNNKGDCTILPDLIENINNDIENVMLDGAYDTKDVYETLLNRKINPIIPPRKNAVLWDDKPSEHPRNQAIKDIEKVSLKNWKEDIGYHQRSLSETAMFRFKSIFTGDLNSRQFKSQQKEALIKCNILNKMTNMGMPITIEIT